MKKMVLHSICISIVPFLILGVIYLLLAYYYQDTFLFGTWINNQYVTGKNVAQVNELLSNKQEVEAMEVIAFDQFGNETTYYFEKDNFSYDLSYTYELTRILDVQNPYSWLERVFYPKSYVILPQYEFSDVDAKTQILDLDFMQYAMGQNVEHAQVSILWSEEGYVLDDTTRHYLDTERAMNLVLDALCMGESRINLIEQQCYFDVSYTEEMKETLALYDKIEEFQSFSFSYAIGEVEEVIGTKEIGKWITLQDNGEFLLDTDGNLVLNEDALLIYIQELGSRYDTLNCPREFMSTRGELITIDGGTYGSELNQIQEFQFLKDAFLNNEVVIKHIPEYSGTAAIYGKNDIGTTYIEIDLTEQMMYYYVDGVQKIATKVVTGDVARGRETPELVCYVYAKQQNRILTGPGYETFVNYWLPVYGGVGIHDSVWRSDYGGTIYLTDGSHGCINTPFDEVKELYELVQVGTPVLMFH